MKPQTRRKPGPTAKRRAARKRVQSKADKLVYAAVDLRDGRCSRLTGIWWGDLVHRHHIQKRRPGNTTVENVISLSPDEHLERIHGLHPDLRLSGNADVIGGVEVLKKLSKEQEHLGDGWAFWKTI